MNSRRNNYRIFFTHLKVMFCLTIISARKSSCGWFGSWGQFACHCPENRCDKAGECLNGYDCLNGWFGPSCQYVNLMASDVQLKPDVEALRDTSRSTYEVLNELEVSWYARYSLSWIRLVVFNTDHMNISSLHFYDNKDQVSILKYAISKKDSTVDIHVELSKSAKRLEIKFTTDISLCTLFISGGRNIALHMATELSSTNGTNEASLAVDNEHVMDSYDPKCTMTSDHDMVSPEWTVRFPSTVGIIGVIIYTKGPLNNLSVEIVHNETSYKLFFNYVDVRKDVVLLELDKVALAERLKISVQDSPLELCEVEIYGEESCGPNKFGLFCDKSCDCRDKIGTCVKATGACWSQCKGDFNDECYNDIALCDKPHEVKNGQWTGCEGTLGSRCSLTCDPDYELIGDPDITCQPSGRYTSPGICQSAASCGEPPDVKNGQWTECGRAIGSKCSLTCDLDYELIGDPQITCQPNGRFTGPGICQYIVLCKEPPDVMNGTWSGQSGTQAECERKPGSRCSLTCASNYELIGDPDITCQPSGRYTSPGICQPILCEEPPDVTNGTWLPCTKQVGDNCTLICKKSYIMNGTDVVTCLNKDNKGSWSTPGNCLPFVKEDMKLQESQSADEIKSSNSDNKKNSSNLYIWLVPVFMAVVVLGGCIYIHVRKKTEDEE